MSKKEKLLKRFLSKPNDFTYSEIVKLLKYFGYKEDSKGRTSGSRVLFLNPLGSHKIIFHKPHPKLELKE